jgi:hypothetical protein
MTWNQDITVSFTLCGTEHGVKRFNRTPITEKVSLIVVRPRMTTKIVLVVRLLVEFEIWGEGLIDTGFGERRERLLAFFKPVSFRAEQSTGL